MIADLITVKTKLNKIVNTYVKSEVEKRSQIFSLIQNKRIIHEGIKGKYNTMDGKEKDLIFKEIGSTKTFSKEELKNLSLPNFLKILQDVILDMSKQIEGGIFEDLNKTIEETGNTFDAKGEKLSIELLLKAYEKLPIDFEEGKAIMPTIVTSPKGAEDYQTALKSHTPEQRETYDKKFNELLRQKYEEFVSRENSRKLVD